MARIDDDCLESTARVFDAGRAPAEKDAGCKDHHEALAKGTRVADVRLNVAAHKFFSAVEFGRASHRSDGALSSSAAAIEPHESFIVSQSSRAGEISVPASASIQSGRLVSVGAGGVRKGEK